MNKAAFKKIPNVLHALPQWVCWRAESQKQKNKLTKVPYNPVTGKRASSTDPATWQTYVEAVGAFKAGGYSGIGFVFTDNDPYAGIDLDKIRNPETGEVEPWARDVVTRLSSYSELSQSGEGFHVIVKGKIHGGRRRKGNVEMYDRGRYFCMTGERLSSTPSTIEERQEILNELYSEHLEVPEPALAAQRVSPNTNTPCDRELIEKASAAKNGANFANLWQGNWESAGYNSQSEADAALLGSLRFWTGGDKARSFTMFSQSGLNRDKWSREDYRERTWSGIDSGNVYNPFEKEELQKNEEAQQAPAQYAWQTSPTPWPTPVNGVDLLNELRDNFTKYLVLAEHAAPALALWALHTYSYHLGRVAAYLALLSPEKRCGKTTALSVMSEFAHRALPASNISPAAVFRVIEEYTPTLLIDETDSFVGDNEELRGMLNAGYSRELAFVIRCVGDGKNFFPQPFNVFGPKLFAGIGKLPGTLADRSIIVPMRRKVSSEQVTRLRHLKGADIRQRCMRWTNDNQAAIEDYEPKLPEGLNDRACDIWQPLIALADIAGGDWPNVSRCAAVTLSEDKDDEESINIKLLSDIRDCKEEQVSDRIFTRDLLSYLNELEERPWKTFSRNNELTSRQLSDRLRTFGIKSRTTRILDENRKGYLFSEMKEAFARYLPPENP